MIQKTKQFLMIVGLVALLSGAVVVFISLQQKPKEEGTPIVLSQEEKKRFEHLEEVKIVTEEEVRGAFSETAFKLTGFEENGMESQKKIQDDYYQLLIQQDDHFLVEKGKEWLNALNKRELFAHFVVNYGLGFDLEGVVEQIKVNETTGEVVIPTPPLSLTHFYIDPTFEIQEENGAIVTLFNRGFAVEEKQLLIEKMENEIKESILHNEQITTLAVEATKEKITTFLQKVNPNITVVFQ